MAEIWSVVVDIATTLGLVFGGIFAYLKFVRGRTFSKRVEVETELVRTDHHRGLATLSWSVKNIGQGILRLAAEAPAGPGERHRGPVALDLTLIDEGVAADALSNLDGTVLWSRGTDIGLDLVQREELPPLHRYMMMYERRRLGATIEPSCSLRGSLLVPWPAEFVAARVLVATYHWEGSEVIAHVDERVVIPEPPMNREVDAEEAGLPSRHASGETSPAEGR